MSEGTYGEAQVLACGCVGACTCFTQPYQDTGEAARGAEYWFTADANGQPYVMTDIGWVDANSAEGQSVLNDPSNVSTVVVQGGDGYWYSQDANGYQYLWTTSGWQATTAETDSDTVTVGPPTGGNSVNDLVMQAIASGDQAAIDATQQIQQSYTDSGSIWLQPGDIDHDKVVDSSDYDPHDPSVQDATDAPIEPDPYDSDY